MLLAVRLALFAARRLPSYITTRVNRKLPVSGLLATSIGLYYLSVFEWLHYFDQYLSLEALHLHGHLRGWAPGTDHWTPATYFVQYEPGVLLTRPTFWQPINMIAARLPYFIGVVDGWHMDMLYHSEFFYIAAAVCFAI